MSRSTREEKKSCLTTCLRNPKSFLPPILVILTCAKVLLIPTYRSTDFDVHRNWLAITHNLPIRQWYFDDVNGTTVHTLDYPPMFAYFEWALSNNPVTTSLLSGDRCLDLLPDSDNDPSPLCVTFQRSTVIMSDWVLWLGAWFACSSFHQNVRKATASFLLIVLNPGLIWLDHIHFQYNGMLLGILLASIGFLIEGSKLRHGSKAFCGYHLLGAVMYALLLNMKHLYLPLAPIYFFYLLRQYCFNDGKFSPRNFILLGIITAASLILPWIPFLLQEKPYGQILQIFVRLFPFGRGLVHDYWAANVWAFFSLADKMVRRLGSRMALPIDRLPEPTPAHCAFFLFVSILPAMITVFRRPTNVKLIQSMVYASLCSFMFAYHVHEKAILTAMIPLTLLVECDGRGIHTALFWQVSTWGLLGLFPLLFRHVETTFKITSYFLYLAFASLLSSNASRRVSQLQKLAVLTVSVVIVILEFLPINGKWEFLPLLIISTTCATGLVGSWIASLFLLLQAEQPADGSPHEKQP